MFKTNDDSIKTMVAEHVEMREWLIGFDETVDYTRLFDPVLLEATTSLEHRYILDRTLSLMVVCGEIDLEFAGINDAGFSLYRRNQP